MICRKRVLRQHQTVTLSAECHIRQVMVISGPGLGGEKEAMVGGKAPADAWGGGGIMPSRAGGGAGGGAVIFVSRMPSPSIMACAAPCSTRPLGAA